MYLFFYKKSMGLRYYHSIIIHQKLTIRHVLMYSFGFITYPSCPWLRRQRSTWTGERRP